MRNLKEDDIRRMTFGRFEEGNSAENDTPDEEIENNGTRFIPLKTTNMFSDAVEREEIEGQDEPEIEEPKQKKKGKKKKKRFFGGKRNDSILAEKIQKLMIFFSLIKNDITQNELNFIDGAIVRTYNTFGITYDNKSLFDKEGRFKKMPTLKDLYNELLSKDKTKDLALMVEKFAVGSLSVFGGSTNVDLDNKYIVHDISEMNEHLKALGMFMALDFVWDKAKESFIQKKVIFLDELWTLIGASGNRLAADYVLEIFKIIRGYGGSAIAATQDITDFFALEDGKYGKAIINSSRIKFVLQMEEDEAFTVQKHLSLSDEETMNIIRNNRGETLLCANRNKLNLEIVASPYEYDLITTKRKDLEQKRKRKEQQEEAENEQSG